MELQSHNSLDLTENYSVSVQICDNGEFTN
jgi:hypothetical protein